MASDTMTKEPCPKKAEDTHPLPPADSVTARLCAADRDILVTLLSEATAPIDHEELHGSDADVRLFGVEAKTCPASPTRFPEPEAIVTGGSMSGGRMPTLSSSEERTLFLRLNYVRTRIQRLLERYAGKRLPAGAAHELIAWGCWERHVRARIVEVNMPLVLAMAKRTRLMGVDFNEMISEGNMALLRSVDKFDCGRGFKFSTYACRAILKSFSRVAMRTSRYRGTFPVEFDPSIERSDHLERQREDIEADCVGELKTIISSNAADLTEVEQTVIVERFALDRLPGATPDPKTLEQVGRIIGVTKERVRQIQNKALKKIRLALEEAYLAA